MRDRQRTLVERKQHRERVANGDRVITDMRTPDVTRGMSKIGNESYPHVRGQFPVLTGRSGERARRAARGTRRSEPTSGSTAFAPRSAEKKFGVIEKNGKMLCTQRKLGFQGRFGS